MTRRAFLRTTSVATGATLLAPPAIAAPAAAPPPAIDTHIHLYDPTRPAGVPWPPKSEATLYRPHLPPDFHAVARPARVVGTIVVEASEWVEDNQWVLDLARDDPAIVGVVGHLKPGRPEFAAELRRFAAHPLFRGLRLRAAYLKSSKEPDTAADLRRVADAGLSLDLLGGPALLPHVFALSQQFPGLRLILDHLPFRDWDGHPAALRTALAGVAAQRNCFIKISDVVRRRDDQPITDPAYYRPALDALLELFGPDRVIFGSNWPVSNRIAPYGVIHGVVAAYFATQPRAVAEKYFWRNSLTAYRWVRRGAAAALP
jgi:L-fuconolactonase